MTICFWCCKRLQLLWFKRNNSHRAHWFCLQKPFGLHWLSKVPKADWYISMTTTWWFYYIKVDLISESFSCWLQSPKKCTKNYPELYSPINNLFVTFFTNSDSTNLWIIFAKKFLVFFKSSCKVSFLWK